MEFNNEEISPSMQNQQIKIENEVGITLEYPSEELDEELLFAPLRITSIYTISEIESDANLQIEFEDEKFVLDEFGAEADNINEPESNVALNHLSENDLESNQISLQSNLFACDECQKTFSHKIGLYQHKKLHNGDRPFTNRKNGGTLRGRKPGIVRQQHGVKRFKCNECPKIFAYYNGLWRHKQSHKVKPLSTRENDGTLLKRKKSQKIVRIINGVKRFSCNECSKIFGNYAGLWRHRKCHTETNVKPFQTREDERTLRKCLKSRKILRPTNGVKRFSCNKCPETFSYYVAMWRHKRSHNETEVKPFTTKENEQTLRKAKKSQKIERIIDGVKQFSCNKCSEIFSNYVGLWRHRKCHTEVDEVKSFSSDENEKETASREHKSVNTDVFICGTCHKKFSFYPDFLQHKRQFHSIERPFEDHTAKEKFACDKCAKILTNEITLKYHKKQCYVREKLLDCDQCERKFSHLGNLTNHKRFQHGVKRIAGDERASASHSRNYKTENRDKEKEFVQDDENQDSQTEFEDKMSVLSNDSNDGNERATENINLRECCVVLDRLPEKPIQKSRKTVFACDKCPRVFSRNYYLHLHKNFHNPEKSFKCDKCPRTFNFYLTFLSHKKFHTKDKPLLSKTNKLSTLQKDKISHNAVKRFKCDKCTKTFAFNTGLCRHKRSHIKDKPLSKRRYTRMVLPHKKSFNRPTSFSCNECQKTFRQYFSLWQHKKLRVCNKCYSCNVCGKKDFTKCELRNHKLTHNETVYKCEICQKNISNYCNLLRHIKTLHAMENLFVCKLCFKIFSSPQLLKEHQEAHVAEGNLKRDECEKPFDTRETSRVRRNSYDEQVLANQNRIPIAGHRKRAKSYAQNDESKWSQLEFEDSVSVLSEDTEKKNSQLVFACDKCPRRFSRNYYLHLHSKSHDRKNTQSYAQYDENKSSELEFEDSVSVLSEGIDNGSEANAENINRKLVFACDKCPRRFSRNYYLHLHSKSHNSEKKFTCNLCPKTFSHTIYLLRHKKLHYGTKSLTNKKVKRTLLKHKKSQKIGRRSYECYVCRLVADDTRCRTNLLEHMFIHSGVKAFSCDQCPRTFRLYRCLWQHKKRRTCIKCYSCNVCGKKDFTKCELRKHKLTHIVYKCEICQKKSSNFCNLLRHIKTLHATEKLFICKLCKKVLNSEQLFKEHQAAHVAEGNLKCDEYEKPFNTRETSRVRRNSYDEQVLANQNRIPIAGHRKRTKSFAQDDENKWSQLEFEDSISVLSEETENKNSKLVFACDKCPRRFSRNYYLYLHSTSHDSVKSVNCNLCPKTFSHNIGLLQHKKVHSRIKSISNKKVKRTLLKHKQFHTIENGTYECYICRFVAKDMSNLLEHMFVHSGVKAFGCDQCPKRFSHNIYLWQHKKCHIGVEMVSSNKYNRTLHEHSKTRTHGKRTFECYICRFVARERVHLREHMWVHGGVKSFSCDICQKLFRHRSGLWQHKKCHSEMKPEENSACDEYPEQFTQKHNLKVFETFHKKVPTFPSEPCVPTYD